MKVTKLVVFLTIFLFTACQNGEIKTEISKIKDTISFEEADFGEPIFPYQSEHTHSASIAKLPNGSLLAVWFQGSQ